MREEFLALKLLVAMSNKVPPTRQGKPDMFLAKVELDKLQDKLDMFPVKVELDILLVRLVTLLELIHLGKPAM